MEIALPVLRTIGLVGVYLSHLMGERRETKPFLRNCEVTQDLMGGGGEIEDGRHLVTKEETGTKGKKKSDQTPLRGRGGAVVGCSEEGRESKSDFLLRAQLGV